MKLKCLGRYKPDGYTYVIELRVVRRQIKVFVNGHLWRSWYNLPRFNAWAWRKVRVPKGDPGAVNLPAKQNLPGAGNFPS